MTIASVEWTDRAGVAHHLRSASSLSVAERRQLDLLRQQIRHTAFLLDAGLAALAVSRAQPNMMAMSLRILLPDLAEQEIAAFDCSEAREVLMEWWASTDASA